MQQVCVVGGFLAHNNGGQCSHVCTGKRAIREDQGIYKCKIYIGQGDLGHVDKDHNFCIGWGCSVSRTKTQA